MKKSKLEKENSVLKALLSELITNSERVSYKFGTDDNNIESDWSEWQDLRCSIQNARTKGNLNAK